MAGVGMVRFLNGADWSESEWFRCQINTPASHLGE